MDLHDAASIARLTTSEAIRSVAVEMRTVYGRPMAYPLNDAAKAIAQLAGTKTLTASQLRIAQDRLGFSIVSLADADWTRAR